MEPTLSGYVACVVVISLFYLLGACLRSPVAGKKCLPLSDRNIFLNLFTGMLFLITAYSIVVTKGKTINWLFLLMGIGYYVTVARTAPPKAIKANGESPRRPFYVYLFLVVGWSLTFFIYFHARNSCGSDYWRPIEIDNYFTAQLSQFLNRGFENTYFYTNYLSDYGPTPYHYCETWLSACIYNLFHTNALYTYTVILPVILLTILLFGYLALAKNNISLAALPFVLVSFLFISDISIFLKDFLGDIIYWPNRGHILIQSKMTFIAIFFLAGIFFWKEKNYLALFYSQLLLLPVSIIAVPAVCSVTGITLLLNLFKTKKIDWKYWFPFLAVTGLYGVYAYAGLGASVSLTEDSSIPWGKMRLLITNPLSYTIRYALWLGLLLLIDRKAVYSFLKTYKIQILTFFIVTTVTSVLLRGRNHDAVQFISAVNPAILSVLFPSVLIIWWPRVKGWEKAGIGILFLIGFISVDYIMRRNIYPIAAQRKAYEQEVVRNLDWSQAGNIAVYSESSGNRYEDNLVEYYGVYGTYLDTYRNDIQYWQINIRKHIREKNTTPYMNYINHMDFIAGDETLKSMLFAQNRAIRYLLVYPDAEMEPAFLSHWKLIAEDEVSGERFFEWKERPEKVVLPEPE